MSKTEILQRVVDQLKATRDMLDVQGGWTKGAFARNATGEKVVNIKSPEVCSFCMAGAMRVATRTSAYVVAKTPLYKYVSDTLSPIYTDWDAIARLNDRRSTTHEQVMFALDFTLAQAKDELKASLKK